MSEFDQLNNIAPNSATITETFTETNSLPGTEEPKGGLSGSSRDALCEGVTDYSRAEHYAQDPDTRRAQLMERLKLKNKILQYQEKFAEELKVYDYKMNQLDELSNPDLEVFLDEVKIAVRQRNSANMTKSFYFGMTNFVEKSACSMGYDITGFHNVLYQQKEIHKCLDELSLEFEDSLYIPAHVRLPYLTLQVALSIHSIRNTENIIKNEFKKKVDIETQAKYQDL